MNLEDIAKLFPHLGDDERAAASAIIAASQPLQDELAKIQREDLRRMLQQQASQLVMSAVQMLGQK